MSELFIGVSRSGTSRDLDQPQPEHLRDFQIASQAIKIEQHHSCQACSFVSEHYQHGHHKDGNHKNNDPRNIDTMCPLCHMCNHLGFVGLNKLGKLVLVDGMSQAQFNVLQRIDWVLRYQVSMSKDVSVNLLNLARRTKHYMQLIEATASQVKAIYKIDDPSVLAEVFLNMSEKSYLERAAAYPNLRLMFEPSSFAKEIESWSSSSSSFDGILHPENWVDIAQKVNETGNIL